MTVDELINKGEDFQARYVQVLGALLNLLVDDESASAAENVVELKALCKAEYEFWRELEATLIHGRFD